MAGVFVVLENNRIPVPVICAFDENLVLAASVALSGIKSKIAAGFSLAVYVLHSDRGLPRSSRDWLSGFFPKNEPHQLFFISVGNSFESAFEIRGITVPTYYRLLLPSLPIPYDAVIYLDVDIAVCDSVHKLLEENLDEYYLAGVRGIFASQDESRLASIGADPREYVNAGVMVLNLRRMREDNLLCDFLSLSRQKLEFQDQDVLNIRCRGSIRHLHPRWNVHCMFDYESNTELSDSLFGETAWREAIDAPGILHFAGLKPWNSRNVWYSDVWWQAYRETPGFNPSVYREFQRRLLQCVQTDSAHHKLESPRGFFRRIGNWLDAFFMRLPGR